MLVLLVVVAALLLLVVVMQIALYRKLKARNKLILSQSHKIKLQNSELEAQNVELQRLNQEKQQIVSVVSHDLKGPFNRIFALIQLMSSSMENFTEDQKDFMGKMHQIVADGLSMIRNLLDNRRLDDQGIEFIPTPLNLGSVLKSLLRNYKVLAEKKKITIDFTAPESVSFSADKSYFIRMVENLLSNALKFSEPDTHVVVTLTTKEEGIEISVKDEGPGLSQEEQQKLFQRYQRLTPKPTGGESSTGLGLYIVKIVAERMGGSVRCESEVGKGATFIIRLPQQSAEQLINQSN